MLRRGKSSFLAFCQQEDEVAFKVVSEVYLNRLSNDNMVKSTV